MISYQWDVQPTVLRIAGSMRDRGFRVWVDTEMMSGSTLDAMAAAVEGAHCVLICITERYKASANCRLEGTYVHERRKAWVPLMLEASYRPTGWLGIMLGSRLYYEFTEAALAEPASWERLTDSVAVEVRRHAPSAGAELQNAAPVPKASATPRPKVPNAVAMTLATPTGSAAAAARDARVVATSGDATPRGISVRSNVTNYTNTNTANVNTVGNRSTVNNCGSIVLV
jgi:hypothetical protein